MLSDRPHRRYNILTGEWIKVSPHRAKRPWQGQVETGNMEKRPEYDKNCYLCLGNKRAGGEITPQYPSTHSFINDFSALIPEGTKELIDTPFLKADSERGICKVICFSPRHDLTIPTMDKQQIINEINLWKKEYKELGLKDFINHRQIFENHGSAMGCSNPHLHGQIWAEEFIPVLPSKELKKQQEYYVKNKKPLLFDYLKEELEKSERVVFENDSFAVLVPFWATWPYETIILPKDQISSLEEFTDMQISDLAETMKILGIKYDNLFQTDFPYSMGIHQKPTNCENAPWVTFHMHYFPPLLRSAEIKKIMVGYEMMAMAQRDITAESSAEILRLLPSDHYRDKK